MERKFNKVFYIIGTGSAGISLFHDIKNKFKNSLIIFLDDDIKNSGRIIEGSLVMAPIDKALENLKPTQNSEVIIALPSSPQHTIRRIYDLLAQNNFTKIKILPAPLSSLESPHLVQTQDIDINMLLSRDTIPLPDKNKLSYLKGKRVLITGAGGTIGTELAIQLLYAGVSRMYLLGHGEHSIYAIKKKISALQQRGVGEHTNCIPILCELTDEHMVKSTLEKLKADVVFHTAAFKHIDLVEENAAYSIAVNIFGTRNVLRYAEESGVEHFVLISTDKAVEPRSIYGASKLVSEELTRRSSSAKMTTSIMRFGNVLGSRGSVLPLFQEQINMGGPITLTSPQCKRYFMTISEACSLILYALQIEQKSLCNQYILEMGDQIYILDIVKQLLDFYGLEMNKDIGIAYIGLRAGEKIEETLITKGEVRKASPIEHIYFLDRENGLEYVKDFEILMNGLHSACYYDEGNTSNYRNRDFIVKLMKKHIPSIDFEK